MSRGLNVAAVITLAFIALVVVEWNRVERVIVALTEAVEDLASNQPLALIIVTLVFVLVLLIFGVLSLKKGGRHGRLAMHPLI